MQTITKKLPNPDCTEEDNSALWELFIADNGIQIADQSVVRRYQNLETSQAEFMDSNELSHYLNRAEYGAQSDYSELADDQFGSDEPESTFQPTLEALDAVFEANSYRFSGDSKVFKGVNTKPYYEIHRFDQVVPGNRVVMHGFLSTSVCRDKALEFAGLSGVLLVILGLDAVNAVIPENTSIASTKRPNIPEQEIILDRGITFEVESVTPPDDNSLREVILRVVGTRPQ
ncbi:hypothetical protein Cthiooxydans_46870 [Comamonas thiooxydans]|uniref:ADP-ribosyltransferase n=1 Tax=Comamonas thiooxydans TaxID=363952 RepID=UPI001E377DFD|nr:ADP-ribosyltransferase [Comamonas thiooxydans]BDB72275.1 hypothetical protein Cthiooxydans_46870 [Comamonas thiooxydans]